VPLELDAGDAHAERPGRDPLDRRAAFTPSAPDIAAAIR
jgi:hypothetical protein